MALRNLIILGCGIAGVLGVYLLTTKTSPQEQLETQLKIAAGDDSAVVLDGCNLTISAETQGEENAPIALTRAQLRADLRLYQMATVRIVPQGETTALRVDRRKVNDEMVAQVERVVAAGGGMTEPLQSEEFDTRRFLANENSKINFQLTVEMTAGEDGAQQLVAHEDGPNFFRFAQAARALPSPISYQLLESYGPEGVAAETLLTAQLVAMPPLLFRLGSEAQAKNVARALRDYAISEGCE